MRRLWALSFFALVALTSRAANADLDLPLFAPLAGPNLGVRQRGSDQSFLAGGEVSAPLSWGLVWIGPYTDVVYDGDFRVTVGPEFGLLWFGVDGGYLASFTDHGRGSGYVVRPTFTLPLGKSGLPSIPLVIGYWRYGRDTHFETKYSEWGLLIKFPFAKIVD